MGAGGKWICAGGVNFNLDRFAHAQQECTRILDPPLYVRDGEVSFRGPMVGEYLHAHGHGEIVIGAMDRENSVDLYRGWSARADLAFNPIGTKRYFGIAGTLENFTVHFAVAEAVAALSGGGVNHE